MLYNFLCQNKQNVFPLQKYFFGRVSIAISVVVCYKKRQVPVPILGKEMVLYRFL